MQETGKRPTAALDRNFAYLGRVEPYDLHTDLGERRDLSSDRPELAGELMELLDRSIGPDPRRPYGLRMTSSGDRVTGSASFRAGGGRLTFRRAYDRRRGLV
ncbi:hypothetical protein Nocox_22365 [Nonomuraea coxensis DSM 45129]|uniref:Uncharacterized protein n=1 Tax=Nonomuraea coxensis DSM 45129 TaxID=1122611 RepID=A0ABX8U2W1_9ACTN|nr:hypothetical protein [Nonomuraea coxensis]QYC42077.1 hypothetical protein Nocox_22365 [Nonomuraea coxensis DSM 45129]